MAPLQALVFNMSQDRTPSPTISRTPRAATSSRGTGWAATAGSSGRTGCASPTPRWSLGPSSAPTCPPTPTHPHPRRPAPSPPARYRYGGRVPCPVLYHLRIYIYIYSMKPFLLQQTEKIDKQKMQYFYVENIQCTQWTTLYPWLQI